MSRKDLEINFYKELANELSEQGFRSFLYDKDDSAWLYVVTPNDSWLYIDKDLFSGYNITFEYVPSKDFGSGCRVNEDPLHEITAETLLEAECYGKNYKSRTYHMETTSDGKPHRVYGTKAPEYYTSGYKAMMNSYFADRLIEIGIDKDIIADNKTVKDFDNIENFER